MFLVTSFCSWIKAIDADADVNHNNLIVRKINGPDEMRYSVSIVYNKVIQIKIYQTFFKKYSYLGCFDVKNVGIHYGKKEFQIGTWEIFNKT